MSRVLVICARKKRERCNVFARSRGKGEAGPSAKRKDFPRGFPPRRKRNVVRGFNETMNYILCGGLPEYPPRRREKSWSNVVSRQVDNICTDSPPQLAVSFVITLPHEKLTTFVLYFLIDSSDT